MPRNQFLLLLCCFTLFGCHQIEKEVELAIPTVSDGLFSFVGGPQILVKIDNIPEDFKFKPQLQIDYCLPAMVENYSALYCDEANRKDSLPCTPTTQEEYAIEIHKGDTNQYRSTGNFKVHLNKVVKPHFNYSKTGSWKQDKVAIEKGALVVGITRKPTLRNLHHTVLIYSPRLLKDKPTDSIENIFYAVYDPSPVQEGYHYFAAIDYVSKLCSGLYGLIDPNQSGNQPLHYKPRSGPLSSLVALKTLTQFYSNVTLFVDQKDQKIAKAKFDNLRIAKEPSDLYYLFTSSGSTNNGNGEVGIIALKKSMVNKSALWSVEHFGYLNP